MKKTNTLKTKIETSPGLTVTVTINNAPKGSEIIYGNKLRKTKK